MKYCSNKDIDKIIRRLVRQGWIFQRGGKHGRLVPPDGRKAVIVAASPSDRRGFQNFRRDLRKITGSTPFS